MIIIPAENAYKSACKQNIVVSRLSSSAIYVPLLTVRTVFSHKKYLHKIIFREGHLAMAPSDNLTCEK